MGTFGTVPIRLQSRLIAHLVSLEKTDPADTVVKEWCRNSKRFRSYSGKYNHYIEVRYTHGTRPPNYLYNSGGIAFTNSFPYYINLIMPKVSFYHLNQSWPNI